MSKDTTRRAAVTGILAAAGAVATAKSAGAQGAGRVKQQAFRLDDLSRQNSESEGAWLPFFDNNTTLAGLYELPAGAEDPQPVHARDEVYVVTKGAAKLRAGDEVFDAAAGSIFFVAAGVPHKFIEIADDLQVIVFFSKASPTG